MYFTLKHHFAIQTKNVPDWTAWSGRTESEWDNVPWVEISQDAKLDLIVVESLQELQDHIPEELFDAIEQSLNSTGVTILDI